jgi:CRP-like cAMP-binding protein
VHRYLTLFGLQPHRTRSFKLSTDPFFIEKVRDVVYLVCEGRISREIPAIQGPGLVMHSVGRGEILGWSWLAPPYKWTFQARTEAPTEVIEFDANAVRSRCDSDPAFGYEIVKRFFAVMSQRLMQSRQKMMAEWSPPGFG